MKQKQNLLLLEDVEDLGRKGEVVTAKPGFARNFLVPKKLAIMADAHTMRLQEKLKKERAVKALENRKEAEDFAKVIEALSLSLTMKVDPEGKMYGSVSSADIVKLIEKEGVKINKKAILLKKPIKQTGDVEILIKLKEDVEAKIILKILPEEIKPKEQEAPKAKKPKEKTELEEEN